ncbi:unnamed protein product [Paramecium octaurelia]|uniref:Casein kinase I n=1 Tax=Paramecium octaurelia TaxID=43137 RepID=A0A8S1T4D6_PAROT|nr:unnamed protein product [Paramecium octaurelia]
MSLNSPKIFGNRFIFKKKLSQGSFGIVYLVLDRATNTECALKAEKEEYEESKTLEKEIAMLIQLDNVIGIPKLIWHGIDGQIQLMAIELLGKDLAYYFKQYRKFSLKCCLQVCCDCLEILKNIHKKFIIHRDLKPENIMMSKELDQIYIVDFGISKIYFEADHIPFREDKDFIGTTRYASIAAHKGYELGRKDDLESLIYVIIYFLRGNLPWQNMPVEDSERNRLVGEMKQTIPLQELIGNKLPELIKALSYIRKLKFEEQPDYEYIKNLIEEAAENNNIKLDGYYDWNEGVKLSKKLSESKLSQDKKEQNSPKQLANCTSKISNQVIWSLFDNSIPQSQKNLLAPPDTKLNRGEVRHLTSSSNNSFFMGSHSSLRLKYLPSQMNKKSNSVLKRMVSIEFISNQESIFNEQMDENFEDYPLQLKIMQANSMQNITFKKLNKFNRSSNQSD